MVHACTAFYDARPAHWKSEKAVCLTFVMILEKLASWHKNAQRVASALCVYRACAPRMSGAGLARSTHVWRAFGVYIHASSSAHTFEHAKKIPTHTANDDECIALVQRWSSALDERVTSDDARLANDNALAKIANFPCAGRASPMRPLCVTGPLAIGKL